LNDADIIFELKDVCFTYNDSVALKNVDLTVRKGEQVCILGANGCGKTTLLRILAGISVPQSGFFNAFGSKITKKSFDNDEFACAYHKRTGFIFQNSDVQLFCTSVLEEIAFGPLQIGIPAREAEHRVNDVAKMLEIETLLPKAPFNLSGGEKKKVALAAVLALNPEVLILDEPTNGLDPRSQHWLIKLLLTMGTAGKTIIVSTHSLSLARQISSRAVLFDENHTIAADAPALELIGNAALLRRVNLVDESYGE
jgi:cobalt/nickel transport system ATP-binding protein